MTRVRVILPYHLRVLARLDVAEITLEVAGPATLTALLDALETAHPALAGTVRDRASGRRRPLIRFFVAQTDWSNAAPDAALPEALTLGREALLIVGAIAGG